ncbi:MAG: cysteine desulfurase [Nanoarchaeota archaeon]|nr:cysteine desulfurase [Nanoarchaeota archaeon]
MELNNQTAKILKNDFPIFRHNLGLVYLDNAATSQKPANVLNVMKDFTERDNANVGRGVYSLAERAMKKYDQARTVVANFLNALPSEIVFTKNTTESLNILSYTLPSILPKEKNEILLTAMEHHSNLVPWQQLSKRNNMKLIFVKVKADFTLDMDDVRNKLTDKTAILALTFVSNVLGTVNPVKEIVNLAKAKGAITIIDAAQAIQHLPVDVRELGCDFLAFSGHKVLGPNGIGVLYGKSELLEKMEPFNFGGGMIEAVGWQGSTWKETPEKFEAGTQNIAGTVGLAESLNYIKRIGFENMGKWEDYLLKYALKRLKEVPGINIYNPGADSSVSLVSFNVGSIHPHDVAELLNEKKIAIRAGHMCAMPLMEVLGVKGGVCRASFSFYNTLEDIDALVDSLKEIKEKFK